ANSQKGRPAPDGAVAAAGRLRSGPRARQRGSEGQHRASLEDGHDRLDGRRHAENPGAYLNQRLMSDLRPTLFLAQLSNLMAGNISIVHGVTGSSRTFMGEEPAGVDATRIALARIQAGQSDLGLVGGAYNSERPEVTLYFALARALTHDRH